MCMSNCKSFLSIPDKINVLLSKLTKGDWKRELEMNYKFDSHKFTHEIIPVATFALISKAHRPLILFPVRCIFPRYTLLMKPQSEQWTCKILVTPACLASSELLKCRGLLHKLQSWNLIAKTSSYSTNLQ